MLTLVVWPLGPTFETLVLPKLAFGFFLLVAKAPLILQASPSIGAFPLAARWQLSPVLSG